MENIKKIISAGRQASFESIQGVAFIGRQHHDSKWGVIAKFENNIGVLFIAGSPIVDAIFSEKNIGKVATGKNTFGLPELK